MELTAIKCPRRPFCHNRHALFKEQLILEGISTAMNYSSENSITLTIQRRSELELQLDNAVGKLLQKAKLRRQGMLVTRSSPETFTVSLSEKVPYGTTMEKMNWL